MYMRAESWQPFVAAHSARTRTTAEPNGSAHPYNPGSTVRGGWPLTGARWPTPLTCSSTKQRPHGEAPRALELVQPQPVYQRRWAALVAVVGARALIVCQLICNGSHAQPPHQRHYALLARNTTLPDVLLGSPH